MPCRAALFPLRQLGPSLGFKLGRVRRYDALAARPGAGKPKNNPCRQRTLADPVPTRRRHADRIDRVDAVKVSFTNFFTDRREGFALPSVRTVPAFEFGFAPENPSLTNRSRSARQSAHQSEVSSSCAIGQYRISSRIHSPIRLPSRDNPIGDGEIPCLPFRYGFTTRSFSFAMSMSAARRALSVPED